MNNFCSIFSKKLLKNCLVFFVVPAILLVACGAPTEEGPAKGKPVVKLPAETAPKTWDKAFEQMLTVLHAPYADGDCFFKAGVGGAAVATPNVVKIMGKNLVVDSTGKFKVPSKGDGHFSISTKGAVGIIPIAVAGTAENAAGTASNIVIEYKDFKPAGSNVIINGKIGLNGMTVAGNGNLAMFFTRAVAATNFEPHNGGTLKIKGPGYTSELSFTKVAPSAAAENDGTHSINNFIVKGAGIACDASEVAAGNPFGGGSIASTATTGAFAKIANNLPATERVIVKFKFNEKVITLVGHGADAKGQDLMKKFVAVKTVAVKPVG